jgi:hypothetical protein
MWAAMAVFMTIRFLIGLLFTLWLLGIALAIVGSIVVGVFNAVTGAGGDPSPSPAVTSQEDAALHTVGAYVYRSQVRRFGGVEPHRGLPRVPPPPNIALPCGVGRGDHVEFVACTDTRTDLLGFGAQSDPSGAARDCVNPTDAYSSGPHWYVCWFAPLDRAWIVPLPSSPNPFVNPLGGALDGDR